MKVPVTGFTMKVPVTGFTWTEDRDCPTDRAFRYVDGQRIRVFARQRLSPFNFKLVCLPLIL